MQDDILGWSLWNEKFQELDGILSVSELHGMVMGIICVVQAPNEEQWRQILALLKVPALNDDAIEFLAEEAEDAAYALQEGELDYLPILPSDEQPLEQRVQALADWCAGVVLGFGLSAQKLTDEEAEQIEVLQSIASVEFAENDNDEDGENAYEELYEHVRLIPVHLAMGRPNKSAVNESPLLKISTTEKTMQSDNTVEMFNPKHIH